MQFMILYVALSNNLFE